MEILDIKNYLCLEVCCYEKMDVTASSSLLFRQLTQAGCARNNLKGNKQMKLTNTQLKELIKEEFETVMSETEGSNKWSFIINIFNSFK